MIRTLDNDDSWTIEKLETHLLARENSMNITTNDPIKPITSTALFTKNKNIINNNKNNNNNYDNESARVPTVCKNYYLKMYVRMVINANSYMLKLIKVVILQMNRYLNQHHFIQQI
jgi:hypothetical protein